MPVQAKSLRGPMAINKKLDVVVHACHPRYTGSIHRRMVV
jgi:hypothetical protein